MRIVEKGRGQQKQPKLKATLADCVSIRVVDENTRFLRAMADLYRTNGKNTIHCSRCRGVCRNDYDLCIYECECHEKEGK